MDTDYLRYIKNNCAFMRQREKRPDKMRKDNKDLNKETKREEKASRRKVVCQHLTTFKMKILQEHTWRFKDIEKKTRQTGGD